MTRTRSTGAQATAAQATTHPRRRNPPTLRPRPPSLRRELAPARASRRSSTASVVFEVSLEGLGASAQDIEALRRIRALITGKAVTAQQEQEDRSSSSQAQLPQQQGATPTQTVAGDFDFNIRQAERYFALLQGQIASALPQQHTAPPPAIPAPAAAAQAAPTSQQHVWHTLQAMQAQLDQWRQQKDASEGQSI
jgi:hypothetical protein